MVNKDRGLKMVYKILLPTDGSEASKRAGEYAISESELWCGNNRFTRN